MIKGCLVGCPFTKHGYKSQPRNGKHSIPETKPELDMSGATTPTETIAKIQDDLLSTGSISTFHTTMTHASCATQKSAKCTKTNIATDASTTNTYLVFNLVTLSENDLSILLAQLAQAVTLQQKSPS